MTTLTTNNRSDENSIVGAFFPASSSSVFWGVFLLMRYQNLGVTHDCHCLTTKNHIPNLVRLANFELRRIGPIRYFLSTGATTDLKTT